MKKSHFAFFAVAAFAGVFGAMRLEKFVESKEFEHSLAKKSVASKSSLFGLGQPAEYTGTLTSPPDFKGAAQRVLPSVVSVDRMDYVQDFFGDSQGIKETGTGSGVIIDSNGTIVTNNHVVAGAAKVRVRLTDKRSFTAKVLGTDPRTDLAIIKVDANDLQAIELADSKEVGVGQWVVAVGNPLGYSGTVSVGVVSSLGRNLMTPESYLTDAIQTDAAINQGNSGGALADAQGRLIGINSAIASPNGGGSVGIGFAIPVNRVKAVAKDIVSLGHARHAGLGVNLVRDPRFDGALADDETRARLKTAYDGAEPPKYGVIVQHVPGESRAAKAGIHDYDILMELDGQHLDSSLDVFQILTDKKPEDEVSVKFWSKGNVKTVNVKLQELEG